MAKRLYFLACILFSFFNASSQISLSFPVERQVFQRNNTNEAYIQIAGNFTVEYDSITAKVEPVAPGQGTATAWQTIDYLDGKPYFYGKLLASGGWYTLNVRAHKNGAVVGTASRAKVGVGEVFVIAGQSNASGITDYVEGSIPYGIGLETSEDRSNIMHWSNGTNEQSKLPFGFSQMSAASVASDTVFIGPFQTAPWCWGKVSEQLVDSLNVPVLFYGAAFGGTKVQWWKESANGEHLTNPSFFIHEELQHPYGALRSVMQYYLSLTGIRAVLWHQGEADQGIYASTYKDYLQQVIARTRLESDEADLVWMVARASWAQGSSYSVIDGQNQTINADVNVFPGPETDNLGGYYYRHDNIHMDKPPGLAEHANYWTNYLADTSFLSNSQPILAKDLLELDFACNNNSTVSLSTAESFDNYSWSNRDNTDAEALGTANDCCMTHTVLPDTDYLRLHWGYDSTNSIAVGPGKYALNVRKAGSGKILFSPVVDLNTLTFPTEPSFVSSASQIRPGEALTLTGSDCNGEYLWSTNFLGSPYTFSPPSTDTYTVQCKTLYCLSSASAATEVLVSSCFPDPLNLSGTVSSTESPYQSQETVESVQQISTPGQIDYKAQKSVALKPGFSAEKGTLFRAEIGNCP
ncbi:sialate O-acetylesterase [Marinilongibacter aquaticus]|uniref:sialate O-acetylesterase n=1 Tax=Marinilongibacter aquaticus TaxID=2975157 RepID=UPI0021BD32E2|nr:sialate O-acetylesterase [Marinilongibacter aquaticus]UBM57444.1 sialate O-acetylesterase [Marinilongibacter aquaticus]